MTSSTAAPISVRPLSSPRHLDAVLALERAIWGYGDLDIDSRAVLTIASRFIGRFFGAFDQERLIGFSLSFYASSPGRLHSHRVGVLPEYQNRGIGFELKLAQREDALLNGIDTIQWTFDPLQSRNAYFNLVRLGGVAKTYLPDFYGRTTSPLHGGLPTDRLLIEWHLRSTRVQDLLAARPLESEVSSARSGEEVCRIKLPPPGNRSDPAAQQGLRKELVELFEQGFVVTSFERAEAFRPQMSECYVLKKIDPRM